MSLSVFSGVVIAIVLLLDIFNQSTNCVPLEKIGISLLSQIRYETRFEPELVRCTRLWQAVDARIRDVDDLTEELRKQVEPNKVDLRIFKQLVSLFDGRQTDFAQDVLIPWLYDCIDILKEKGAREHDEDERNVGDNLQKMSNNSPTLVHTIDKGESMMLNLDELKQAKKLTQPNLKVKQQTDTLKVDDNSTKPSTKNKLSSENMLEEFVKHAQVLEVTLSQYLNSLKGNKSDQVYMSQQNQNELLVRLNKLERELREKNKQLEETEQALKRETERFRAVLAQLTNIKSDMVLKAAQLEETELALKHKSVRYDALLNELNQLDIELAKKTTTCSLLSTPQSTLDKCPIRKPKLCELPKRNETPLQVPIKTKNQVKLTENRKDLNEMIEKRIGQN